MKIHLSQKRVAALLLAVCIFILSFASGLVNADTTEESGEDIFRKDFSAVEGTDELAEDFNAYYYESVESLYQAEPQAVGDLWCKSDDSEKIRAVKNAAASDFKNLTVLTYKNKSYTDFEASMTFQQSWQRFGIMFGTDLGEYAYIGTKSADAASKGGVLVYVEAEGGRVGIGAVTGGRYDAFNRTAGSLTTFVDETGKPNANISAGKMHTLTVSVTGQILTVTVDGLEESKVAITLSEDYFGGYVSLVTNSVGGGFGSISITDRRIPPPDDYSIDFTSLGSIDDINTNFSAYYYSSVAESAHTDRQPVSSLWRMTEQDRITAVTKNNSPNDYTNLTVLTYSAKEYTDFEAAISFEQSWQRFGLMFGTQPGEYAYTGTASNKTESNGGIFVYIEAEGGRVAIGAVTGGRYNAFTRVGTPLSSFLDENGKPGSLISAKTMHTLNIKVVGNEMTVTVDGLEESEMIVTLDGYDGGYLSLVTNTGSGSGGFGAFSVKKLEGETVETDYSTVDFKKLPSLSRIDGDYEAYYLDDAKNSPELAQQKLTDIWKLNNNHVLAANKSREGTDVSNVSVLTYAGKSYTDFELTVKYQQTYNRLGIIFGADKNKYVIDESSGKREITKGTLVYIEAEGVRTAIGDFESGYTNSDKKMYRLSSPELPGFTDDSGSPAENIAAKKTHMLKIVVKDRKAYIFVDNAENYVMYLELSPEYDGGYISIISTATDTVGFEYFSISEKITTPIIVGGFTETESTVHFDFNDMAMPVDTLDAYYISEASEEASQVKFSDYWSLDGSKLYRRASKTNSSDTTDLAVLTYNKRKYTDFKASVKYQKNSGRLMLMFGTEKGKFTVSDNKAQKSSGGAAVYIENDFGAGGALVVLGDSGGTTARRRVTDLNAPGYHQAGNWNSNINSWHELQIWVYNRICYIFLDEYGLLYSFELPSSYSGGYISLVSSMCGGSGFDDLIITDLNKTDKNSIISYEYIRDLKVQKGTAMANIGLPDYVTVTSLNGKSHIAGVTWYCGDYDPNTIGYYEFTGLLQASAGFDNAGKIRCRIGVEVIDYDPTVIKKWNFDSDDALFDFSAFHIDDVTEDPESYALGTLDEWLVRDGRLWVNRASEGSDTKNLSILTYTGETYRDFELEVDFSQYYTRCMVMFGSKKPGQYIFSDINYGLSGAVAAYVEFEGSRVAIGETEYPDKNGYMVKEDLKEITDYIRLNDEGKPLHGVEHRLRLRVSGRTAEIYVDGAEIPLKIYLPDSYEGGYISLVSCSKRAFYDNLSIKRLASEPESLTENNAVAANGYLNLRTQTLEEIVDAEAPPLDTPINSDTGKLRQETEGYSKPLIIITVILSAAAVVTVILLIVYKKQKNRRYIK